jgi:CubicO group peptidase (beta-lactamase class C family)
MFQRLGHFFVFALLLSIGCGSEDRSSPAPGPLDQEGASSDEYPLGNDENWLQPAYITASLRSVDQLFPTRTVHRAEHASELRHSKDAASFRDEIGYEVDGVRHTLTDFPERTRTTGLLVLHDGEVLYEGYFRGADESSRFLSMSVAKSFTSTLVGLARAEGRIGSFDDPVTDYIPRLSGTGYDGVSIEHILQMSSGIDFVEEYADPESDIARLGDACFGGPERLEDVAVSYGRKFEPGSDFYYASVDTAILGWLLRTVTGENLSSYLQEKIWQPIGAEADAFWVLDQEGDNGVECALGGFNASLRDYGRFGLLMARDGVWNGKRILPEGWVAEATIPSSPQVQPGELEDGYELGYQYQWWTFPGADHSFTAEGIHGQLLMVNPALDLVLVKTSDWETAWEGDKERETWALFDAIADWIRAKSAS